MARIPDIDHDKPLVELHFAAAYAFDFLEKSQELSDSARSQLTRLVLGVTRTAADELVENGNSTAVTDAVRIIRSLTASGPSGRGRLRRWLMAGDTLAMPVLWPLTIALAQRIATRLQLSQEGGSSQFRLVLKNQAAVEEKQGMVVADLVRALESQRTAVVQIGSNHG